jgi:hypothetical protein
MLDTINPNSDILLTLWVVGKITPQCFILFQMLSEFTEVTQKSHFPIGFDLPCISRSLLLVRPSFLAHELYTAAIVYGLCTTFISYGVGVFFFRLIKKMAKIKTSEEIRVSETREPKVNLGAIFFIHLCLPVVAISYTFMVCAKETGDWHDLLLYRPVDIYGFGYSSMILACFFAFFTINTWKKCARIRRLGPLLYPKSKIALCKK